MIKEFLMMAGPDLTQFNSLFEDLGLTQPTKIMENTNWTRFKSLSDNMDWNIFSEFVRTRIILFATVIGLCFLVQLLIGIFVWKDAGRRGMSRVWGLVAALIPNLLGLIVYLIVASQQKTKTKCPQCKEQVDKDYNVCPHCGLHLRETCPQCKGVVSPDWNICPQCGQQLPK